MYIQEITIKINSQVDKDTLIELFGSLMSSYRSSGQTQGRIESQYIVDDTIVCFPFTLEENSLNKKFNNFYVNKKREQIEALCNAKLNTKTVGKSYETYEAPCRCKKSDFYMLATNYITISSPITCGTCHKAVPLYRLPHYHDHGYMPILSWETNYISCDSLQMNCEVGERWALNQMQNLNSQLAKQGLQICRNIEDLTSIPTYYYLYNHKKYKGNELTRPCPNCKQPWSLHTRLHNSYDFKCDKCRIISNKSFNR